MPAKLNIVFHRICHNPTNKWEMTPDLFLKIYRWCLDKYPNFRAYFDDGNSMLDLGDHLDFIATRSTLAIATDILGNDTHISWNELSYLYELGFTIASHGTSHASLCVYDPVDNQILPNPAGGKYISALRGKRLLSERQVEYQLIESKKALLNHGVNVNEFVFPYGLYSNQTLKILDELKIYDFYSTCDERLYNSGKIIPRVLICGDKTFQETIKCLIKVIER